MSNGDDTEYISAEEKRGWIDESAPLPWSDISPTIWRGMTLDGRTNAVDGYMASNDIKLQGEEEEDEPTYLGGYIAPVQTLDPSGFGTMFRPRAYEAGDEYSLFTDRGSSYIANLQDRMINAGLIKEDGVFRFGQWTSYEAKAMKNVLALANETGLPWNSVLVDFRRRRAESDKGTGGALPTKFLENEDELTARLAGSLPGLLGGNFLPESDARAIAPHIGITPAARLTKLPEAERLRRLCRSTRLLSSKKASKKALRLTGSPCWRALWASWLGRTYG